MRALNIDVSNLSAVEKLTLKLRGLYESRGYRLFSMNRLEEYSLYVENMDFLKSREIIVFSDLDGRLMALKPDITLSIAKSVNGESGLQKLYYHENVFRPARHAREFREIAQTGLECIGALSAYDISEILFLAQRTLFAVDESYVLDVSHLGFVSAVLEELGADGALSRKLLNLLQKKAPHELAKLAKAFGMGEEELSTLMRLATVSGGFDETVSIAKTLCREKRSEAALNELVSICEPLQKRCLRLDFSIVSDLKYYNGVVFQGYVPKVPEPVLSGGQYDLLLQKMGKRGKKAAGFALYLDGIERYYGELRTLPPVITILYDPDDSPANIFAAVEQEAGFGGAVRAVTDPKDATGRVVDLRKKGADHA